MLMYAVHFWSTVFALAVSGCFLNVSVCCMCDKGKGYCKCYHCIKYTSKQHAQIFYILLTEHLDVILVNYQPDALFSMCLFDASTCFEQQVLIIRRIKLCQYIIRYNTL
jgi:hypothetical protein